MTIHEFLTKLRATRRPWRFTSTGVIRSADGRCPIVAVARGLRHNRTDWWRVYRRLNLSASLAHRIAYAADNRGEARLRQQLLAATVYRTAMTAKRTR